MFLAAFTTAYGRLELYTLMEQLQRRVLYHDTDSVVYVSKQGDWNPPLSNYLGGLTSELEDGDHITYPPVVPKAMLLGLKTITWC